MGKGLALQFEKAIPANFRAYEASDEAGALEIGKMFVFSSDAAPSYRSSSAPSGGAPSSKCPSSSPVPAPEQPRDLNDLMGFHATLRIKSVT
jgi:hypothetical protein